MVDLLETGADQGDLSVSADPDKIQGKFISCNEDPFESHRIMRIQIKKIPED
jgi:hypothetical protein